MKYYKDMDGDIWKWADDHSMFDVTCKESNEFKWNEMKSTGPTSGHMNFGQCKKEWKLKKITEKQAFIEML